MRTKPHVLRQAACLYRQVCKATERAAGSAASTSLPEQAAGPGRRTLLSASTAGLLAAAALWAQPQAALAIQGSTAGRIPGLKGPGEDGLYTYTRPEGKSGGHGTGWTEIPRYSFKVPAGWKENPVSIADLGGTEIDLRFGNSEEGNLEVIVAPIARFMDTTENTKYTIEQLGKPDKIINGFHPEIFGRPMTDDELLDTQTLRGPDGLTHYSWELKNRHLVAATAYGNRMFLMALTANGRQWRRSADTLRNIQSSFQIVDAV